jgi:hypothetical protein
MGGALCSRNGNYEGGKSRSHTVYIIVLRRKRLQSSAPLRREVQGESRSRYRSDVICLSRDLGPA